MLNANPAEIKSQCHGHKKKRGDFSNLSRIISAEQIYNFNYICKMRTFQSDIHIFSVALITFYLNSTKS